MSQPTYSQAQLTEVRAATNQRLHQFYQDKIAQAGAVDVRYAALWQAMSDLDQAGGKRLRAYLTVLGYESFGGIRRRDILNVACAQELLNTSLLIHDDIIDRDYVRRGQANVAGQFRQQYAQSIDDPEEARHFADGAALLAGDALLAGAYELIADSNFPAADKLPAMKLLGQSMYLAGGGQLLDMEASWQPAQGVDTIKIARYKTASYSFIGPLTTGAGLAHALPAALARLRVYGEALGIAFQLADDLLGIFGDEAVTGKSTLGDLREGKRTYLLQQTVARASASQRRILETVVGNPRVTPDQAAKVRRIMMASGAKAQTERLRDEYGRQAVQALQHADVPARVRRALEDMVAQTLKRGH